MTRNSLSTGKLAPPLFLATVAGLTLIPLVKTSATEALDLAVLGIAFAAAAIQLPFLYRPQLNLTIVEIGVFVSGALLYGAFQLAPIPALAHPIWTSASAALDERLWGAITVDKTATSWSLMRVFEIGAMTVISAVMTMQRATGYRTLVIMTCTSAVIVGLCLVARTDFGAAVELLSVELFQNPAGSDTALGFAYLGLTLSVGWSDLEIERAYRRQVPLGGRFLLVAIGCGVAFLICGLAIGLVGNPGSAIASGMSVATLGLIRGSRLLPISNQVAAALITILVAGIGLFALEFIGTQGSIALAFTSIAPPVNEMASRMAAEAPFFGTGLGTFDDLIPLYQLAGDRSQMIHSPTTALSLVVEIGLWPTFVVLCLSLVGFWSLLWGSLRRGRDVAFSAMGAALIGGVPLLACADSSLSQMSVQFAMAGILGLSLTQRRGRTSDAATLNASNPASSY